jgi:ATP-dependent DNA helicase DinG
VINHHLLCADFALKEEGFGELLPAADCFIIDEAHQLPDIANQFFGVNLSARQLQELTRDTEAEYHAEAGDQPVLLETTGALDKAVRDFRLLFGLEERRGAWSELEEASDLTAALAVIAERLASLETVLQSLAGRGRGLDACLSRCQALATVVELIGSGDEPGTAVRWFETSRLGFRLSRTPLDIAEPFRHQMTRRAASWIFTSATLAVGDSFAHFQRQLGLDEASTARWDSPFDYPSQGLWYVPRAMPDPRERGYTAAVVERAVPVIEASHGRTFMLFTSHRALQAAARLLAGRVLYPLLVQGSAPRTELLERFRNLGNAVLLGTGSFWEGVDVSGEALSCVIIDKLPFAAPGDPVLQARLDVIRARGGNPFMDYQVPQAVIALKQGSGRLIRDRGDRGVLMTCDPRMLSKPYGRVFLDAMPAFSRTRELDDVIAFFASSVP